MKKIYQKPITEIVIFEEEDVITTSGATGGVATDRTPTYGPTGLDGLGNQH